MKIYNKDQLLWECVKIADNPFKCFKGLMWKKELKEGEGLLIKRCKQIHTFNMRFPIDVIYLSKKMQIIQISSMQSGKIGPRIKEAASVLEVKKETATSLGIKKGDFLNITEF